VADFPLETVRAAISLVHFGKQPSHPRRGTWLRLSFAGRDRVLFGTDLPYAPEKVTAHFAGALESSPALRVKTLLPFGVTTSRSLPRRLTRHPVTCALITGCDHLTEVVPLEDTGVVTTGERSPRERSLP
jgi:hypothetical protein